MAETIGKKTVPAVINLENYPCPACGSTDRWAQMETVIEADHNPSIRVLCDCGIGELLIVVE